MIERQISHIIEHDLARKMVFIAGPRQCGKTTLAKHIAKKTGFTHRYYNWDIDADRKTILNSKLATDSKLWVLDELHKYRHWKNFLKGQFDQHHPDHHFLVTGSAKLDAYSRGGDSLQGRYYFHRLHPFVLSELSGKSGTPDPETIIKSPVTPSKTDEVTLETLLRLGGFPEPFLSGSDKEAARWRLAYSAQLIREEIRNLERLQDIDRLELLYDRLPETVGSVLSINSLREDLEVAFETVRHWILILENLYAVFRIPPFGAPKIKAVKKEQKLYFRDWAKVEEGGARLENCVAAHLLRFTDWQENAEGEKWELRYFRDVNGHEVDFILLRRGKPWCAVEVKRSQSSLDPNLKYLLERVRIPYAFQVHLKGTDDFQPSPINNCKIRIMPVSRFLLNGL